MLHMRRIVAVAVMVAPALAVAMVTSTAHADIIYSTGAINRIAPPASLARGAWESNTDTLFFQEQSGLILTDNLMVDISTTGVFMSPGDFTPSVISAGTMVDSYFLHQDAVGRNETIYTTSSVTFDTDILGVIASNRSLTLTDPVLGRDDVDYPTGTDSLRGLDWPSANDMITISPDRRTIIFNLQTHVALDHIRIVTATAPTPGTAALLIMAGISAVGRRRRKNA